MSVDSVETNPDDSLSRGEAAPATGKVSPQVRMSRPAAKAVVIGGTPTNAMAGRRFSPSPIRPGLR